MPVTEYVSHRSLFSYEEISLAELCCLRVTEFMTTVS